jgi:hypothetical protein
MDTGVEHGPPPDLGAGTPPSGVQPRSVAGGHDHAGHHVSHHAVPAQHDPDDIPTTILDLRTAFAQAGSQAAAPLGVVRVEREHPLRAALAFMAVLALIAGAAGGIVVGIAAAGKAVYAKLAGPAECSTQQVADGAALEAWLLAVMRDTVGPTARVARFGCAATGALDPLSGQSAAATIGAGRSATRLVAVLRKRDCTLGTASSSGTRSCTAEIGTRLVVVEVRPRAGNVTTTVSFR